MNKQAFSPTQEFASQELVFRKEKIDVLIPRFFGCFPGSNTVGLAYPSERENIERATFCSTVDTPTGVDRGKCNGTV